MVFNIKGIIRFSFELDKEKMLVNIYDGNELIDTMDIDSIDTMEQEIKDYIFTYVI